MAVVAEVIAANASYVAEFGNKGQLALPPARRFAILTCMDARLDPAKYAGLAEGDAHVIRNAGGRATDDAIRSLVISHKLLATVEFFVIHHTNCGMELFSDEVMAGLLDDNLATASFDGKTCAARRRLRGWPFHQVADDPQPGGERDPGRSTHPGASPRASRHPHLRICLRREDWPPRRSEEGDRSRATGIVTVCIP